MTSLLTIFVPTDFQSSIIEDAGNVINGSRVPTKYQTRIHAGHYVIDVPRGTFQRLIGGNQGKLWLDCNPEAQEWIGRNPGDMTCHAFPGEHRPPPHVAAPTIAPVIMVRMRAPDSVTSLSIEGADLVIGDDRIVAVTEAVAEMIRGHGFAAVA